MTDPINPKNAPSASGVMEPAADCRDTVMLSDAGVSTVTNANPAASPALTAANFNSATLAALGQRYDIFGEAGHGNMGNVYKARDRETGETVAIKLVKPEYASDQAMMERFKNELLFARKITHKNVCRVYDLNRIGGVAYTSMEFVEGESLRSVLNRFGGLPPRKAVDLALQICSGLKEAHTQGIVHRDLKPENVMIDSRGNVKIMDFGIARSMEAATRITGAMIGTPAYMAPEQVAGKPVDYRTDIYSLGLMLYEIFTGKPAFVADNPVAVALKQMRESPAPPHEIEPAIPVSIERAILKCIEKEPAKRFQSVSELENALTSSASRAVPTSSTDAVPTAPVRGAAIVTVPAAGTIPESAPRRGAKRTSPIAWPLLGAFFVTCTAGGIHWITVARATKPIPAPSQLPAPVPPAFAFEKPPAQPPAFKPAASALPEEATATLPAPKAANAAATKQPRATPEFSAVAASIPGTPPSDQGHALAQPAAASQPDGQQGPVAAVAQPNNLSDTSAKNPNNAAGPGYVWIGRFQREDRAQQTAKKIEDLALPVVVIPRRNPSGELFVVLSGPFAAKKAADVMQQLKGQGFTNLRLVKNPNINQETNQ
jgi:hypothetical protein